MSRTSLIGIGLFILGVAGALYIADELFVHPSGFWYSTVIASIIMATIGLAVMWKELGRKRQPNHRSQSHRQGKRLGKK